MSNALLLAEPEPATRGFLERHLRQDGFDVVEALDGEAVELLELTRPDLVLAADSLAADLCRRAANVPIIVLGRADSDPVDRVRAFDGGCDDYVSRPFHYEELLARIRAVLRRVSPPPRERIEGGDLLIDRPARRVTVRAPRSCSPRRNSSCSSSWPASPRGSSRRSSFCARSGASDPWGSHAPSTRTPRGCGGSSRPRAGTSSGTCGASGTRLRPDRFREAGEHGVPASLVVGPPLRVIPATVLEVDPRAALFGCEAHLDLGRSALRVDAPAEDEAVRRFPRDDVGPIALLSIVSALVDPAADLLVEDDRASLFEDPMRPRRPPGADPAGECLERRFHGGLNDDGFVDRSECLSRAHPLLLSCASASA